MNNPAFIVDGYTELKILQHICPGSPVKRTDCNGKNVKLSAIAKKIAWHIRLLNNKYYPIVILIDKEERDLSFERMAEIIKEELTKQGINNQDLRIGVADRMIENWIIADWEQFSNDTAMRPNHADGCNPNSFIRKITGGYDKTTDGVDFFMQARPNVIYENSPSFRHFINQLLDIECHYTQVFK